MRDAGLPPYIPEMVPLLTPLPNARSYSAEPWSLLFVLVAVDPQLRFEGSWTPLRGVNSDRQSTSRFRGSQLEKW